VKGRQRGTLGGRGGGVLVGSGEKKSTEPAEENRGRERGKEFQADYPACASGSSLHVREKKRKGKKESALGVGQANGRKRKTL